MSLAEFRITRFQFARDRVIGDSQVRADDANVAALELISSSGQVGLGFIQTLFTPLPDRSEIERIFAAEVWPGIEGQAAIGLVHRVSRPRGGNQRAYVAPAADISAIGIKLKGVPVGVTDLGDISARLIGKRVIFILGHDFFAASRLSIDIEGGTIEQFASGTTPVGVELSVADHDGISSIPVEVGRLKAMADFDLGNGTGVLISKSFAERLRLPVVGLEPAGGIGGSKLREVVYLPSLTIAGKRFDHVRCRVDPRDFPSLHRLCVG